MEKRFTEEEGQKELEKGYKQAKKILKDEDKMETFLYRLENKLKKVPLGGDVLSMVPVMISMLRSYFKKEYTDIPIGTIIAVVSALLYWLAPLDIVPDSIPVAGFIDDATVIASCLKLIGDDLKEYKKWQEKNKILE